MTGEFSAGLDGWVYCCHGFANTIERQERRATRTISMTVRQHLPHQARRLARSSSSPGARSTRSASPSIRAATSTPPTATRGRSTSCSKGGLLPQLRQAARRPRLRPRDGQARPRLDRHRRRRLLRTPTSSRRSTDDNVFIGNVITNRVNRDRIELERLVAAGHRAAGLRRAATTLVPPGGHQARPGRRPVRRRLLQPHHRPLRGAADHPGRDRERGRIWRLVPKEVARSRARWRRGCLLPVATPSRRRARNKTTPLLCHSPFIF